MAKLLTLGILFSIAVRAVVVVAKLVMLGILALTSFILALTLFRMGFLGAAHGWPFAPPPPPTP